MTSCAATPEQREAVLTDLVVKLAGENNGLRKLVGVVGQAREDLEDEMIKLAESAVGRVLRERGWAENGREARVAKLINTELRLEIRRHFAG